MNEFSFPIPLSKAHLHHVISREVDTRICFYDLTLHHINEPIILEINIFWIRSKTVYIWTKLSYLLALKTHNHSRLASSPTIFVVLFNWKCHYYLLICGSNKNYLETQSQYTSQTQFQSVDRAPANYLWIQQKQLQIEWRLKSKHPFFFC